MRPRNARGVSQSLWPLPSTTALGFTQRFFPLPENLPRHLRGLVVAATCPASELREIALTDSKGIPLIESIGPRSADKI